MEETRKGRHRIHAEAWWRLVGYKGRPTTGFISGQAELLVRHFRLAVWVSHAKSEDVELSEFGSNSHDIPDHSDTTIMCLTLLVAIGPSDCEWSPYQLEELDTTSVMEQSLAVPVGLPQPLSASQRKASKRAVKMLGFQSQVDQTPPARGLDTDDVSAMIRKIDFAETYDARSGYH